MDVIVSRELVLETVHYSLKDSFIIQKGDKEYYSLSVDDMRHYKLFDDSGRTRVKTT